MASHKKRQVLIPYYATTKTTLDKKDIVVKLVDTPSRFLVSQTFCYYLKEIIQQIEQKRPYIHPFEELHKMIVDPDLLEHTKTSLFFEMVETLTILGIHFDYHYKINVFHIGPQCMSTKKAVEHIYKKHTTRCLYYGQEESFDACCTNVLYDMITLHNEFIDEYDNAKHILRYLPIALVTQKNKGSLVIRMSSFVHALTIDILYMLSSMYSKVYITSPMCTNPLCDVKYVVCKGYLRPRNRDALYAQMKQLYHTIVTCPVDKCIDRIIQKPIPLYFINKIEELNSIFGQPRLEQLYMILTSVENKQDKIQEQTKCIEWCLKHKIAIQCGVF